MSVIKRNWSKSEEQVKKVIKDSTRAKFKRFKHGTGYGK